MRIIMLFIATTFSVFSYSAQHRGAAMGCELTTIQSEEIPAAAGVAVKKLQFSSGVRSFSELRVTNTNASEVKNFLFMVEYFDAKGNYLLTIPFYSIDFHSAALPSDPSVREWLSLHQNTGSIVLPAAQEVTLRGESANSVVDCPTRARISRIELNRADFESFNHAEPDWRTDAVIVKIVQFRLGRSESLPSPGYIGNLEASRDGTARFRGAAEQSKNFFTHLVAHLQYLPATISGVPVDSVLPIVLQRAGADLSLLRGLKNQTSVAILTPYTRGNARDVFVLYGGVPTGTETLRKHF